MNLTYENVNVFNTKVHNSGVIVCKIVIIEGRIILTLNSSTIEVHLIYARINQSY